MRTDWHSNFANALLHPEEAIPPGLRDPYGQPTLKRFAVYRNNIVSGLIEALRVDFPAVSRIVGDDFFAAMARVYVAKHPPRSPVLLEYGGLLAEFIDNFGPAGSLPYLGDVARIERAWIEAYHAPDVEPLHPCVLTSIWSEQFHDTRLCLHPSVRCIRSMFPTFTIWSTNIEGGTPIAVDLAAGGENVLVSRPAAEVEVRSLSDGGVEFIRSIAAGKTIGQAGRAALSIDPSFDREAMLVGMTASGIVVSYMSEPAIANDERGPCVA